MFEFDSETSELDFEVPKSSIWKHTTSRDNGVFFLSIIISQLWQPIKFKFSQVCSFVCYWDTPSEKTGLWQPIVSSVFNSRKLVHMYAWHLFAQGKLSGGASHENVTLTGNFVSLSNTFVLSTFVCFQAIRKCKGLQQGAVVQYTANKTRNTGAKLGSFTRMTQYTGPTCLSLHPIKKKR